MMFWCNLIGYQLVWLLVVSGASRGHPWPAMMCGAVFVAWQVVASDQPGVELRLVLLALLLGIVIDGVLHATGWLRYASPSPSLPPQGAPVWILVLWASFAMTLNRSLALLRGRPWLAAAFGGIGAPLAYLAAARGWHAITFETDMWLGIAWLVLGWAFALPLLVTLADRWVRGAHARLL